MPHKPVLVHHCFHAGEPFKMSSHNPELSAFTFHRFLNRDCSCRYHISRRDRDALCMMGELYVATRLNEQGRDIPEFREVIVAFRDLRARRAHTVSKWTILDAYVEGRRPAQDFIEELGQPNQEIIASIGASMDRGGVIERKAELRKRGGISPTAQVIGPQPEDYPLFRV
jgi:hypothetical protein